MAKVSLSQLSKVVADLSLKRGASDKHLAKSIAAYLLEERRVNELESLLRDVQKAWANKGHVDVLARIARPLSDTTYKQLAIPFNQVYSSAKTVNVTPIVDPEVIGGASLELGEQRLDISFARRLSRFKKAINVKDV
jgi:F0F1-type ATP synthase delta subunit